MVELSDMIILVGVVGGVYCYYTNAFGFKTSVDEWLKGLGSIGGGGGGGGGVWYRANGPTQPLPRSRCSTSRCGTGSGDSGGNRWEQVINGFMDVGYEVVFYVQMKAGSMCSGGHVGLKHGGPNHSSGCSYKLPSGAPGNCGQTGTCCCWWDSGVHDNMKPYIEIERSHNKNCRTREFSSIGTKLDTGRAIGFRWHISREGQGIRLMFWVDTSGIVAANRWRQIYNILDTGQIMPRDYYTHITRDQDVEIRISDIACGDVRMLYGPFARKIDR